MFIGMCFIAVLIDAILVCVGRSCAKNKLLYISLTVLHINITHTVAKKGIAVINCTVGVGVVSAVSTEQTMNLIKYPPPSPLFDDMTVGNCTLYTYPHTHVHTHTYTHTPHRPRCVRCASKFKALTIVGHVMHVIRCFFFVVCDVTC